MYATFTNQIKELKKNNLYREMRVCESVSGRTLIIDGKEYINFSSNNYLGYAHNSEVIKAAQKAIEQYGASVSASRLISGTLPIHQKLEHELSLLKKKESTLIFPTGYQASVGVLTALVGKEDAVVLDRLCHASLIDGARLSGAQLLVYPHRDINRLKTVMARRHKFKNVLIVTDGLFSMDGDIAPIPEIVKIAEQYEAYVLIDDAHATGVLGAEGRGTLEYCSSDSKQLIIMATLSKALGSQGGFVSAQKEIIEMLINKARSFIYTTGLNPGSCGAALKSIELISQEPEKRIKLLNAAKYVRACLKSYGYNTLDSESQIIPVLIGDTGKTLACAQQLFSQGIYCPAIRPPTVPYGKARLRISLTIEHTDDDIKKLLDSFNKKRCNY